MARRQPTAWLASVLVVYLFSAVAVSAQGTRASYQVVKVCSLVSLAEVKKLAPWPAHLDPYAKAEEEAIGTRGSSCNYPSAFVQVMAYGQQMIDALRKSGPLETVAGLGDEAFARDNRGNFAEVLARVGPHLLTVQLSIDTNQTYATAKPTAIELARLFAAKLR